MREGRFDPMREGAAASRGWFGLRALIVVLSAVGLGMAVTQIAPLGTPEACAWAALCAPSFTFVTTLEWLVGAELEAAFPLSNGVLYGFYAACALVRRGGVVLGLVLAAHVGCFLLAAVWILAGGFAIA
jgi:hypothetical protein